MFSHHPSSGFLRRKTLTAACAAAILIILGGTFANGTIVARPAGPANGNLERHAAMGTPRFASVPVKKATPILKSAAPAVLPVLDQQDIRPRHKLLANKVLRALPPKCRDSLQSFYVTYDRKSTNRGLGGESVIIVNGNVPDREFMALLVHECGHVVDIGSLRGTLDSGRSSFVDGNMPIFTDDPSVAFYQISWITPAINQPGSAEADFVSGYAMWDPFEDFAETFAYYALQRKEFQRLAEKNPVMKAKYDFMERAVFSGEQPVALGKHVRGRAAPWDVTKLPYMWIAKL